MKRRYVKPMLSVEYYTLTQSIASCSGIKIGFANAECIENDIHSTNEMKDWAAGGAFLAAAPTDCAGMFMDGYQETNSNDLICYHTSINTAFTS